MVVFRQMINAPAMSDLRRQILAIVLAVGAIEFIGAVLLYQFATVEGDLLSRIWWSIFHAISVFCNADFALHGDSLVSCWWSCGRVKPH